MASRMRAAGLLWQTLVMLPALAVLIGLGSWQLQRMAWKQDILATIASRAKAEPLTHAQTRALSCVAADADLARSCEYTRVRITGRLDTLRQRHVFAGAQGAGPRAEVGYWVFVPFDPEGEPILPPIFVNLGFLPERLKSEAGRIQAPAVASVQLTAHVRTREPRGTFAGANDPARNIYFVRDPIELAGGALRRSEAGSIFGNGLFYLEVVEGGPAGGFPRPMAGQIDIPNRHLEYALTWFGLALTLLGVYAAFAWSRLRPPAA